MADDTELECGGCGHPLPAEWLALADQAPGCPDCGSVLKTVKLRFSDSVSVKARDTLKGKVKDLTFPSKKRVRREFFYGADERRSKGDYVDKEREIDRDNDYYREVVREEDTGEIIHSDEGKLSDHFGHGSAKFRKPEEGSS